MSWWEAALLGLLQGLTEFLPISSSGHLVLARHLLGIGGAEGSALTFDVLVHFGTMLSIVVYYRKEVLTLIHDFFESLISPRTWTRSWEEKDGFRTSTFVLVTMIPTGLAFWLFQDRIEAAFSDPRIAASMLLVTGVLLLLTLVRRSPDGNLTTPKVILIGIAQAFAMIPGISRSAATICTALYQNVEPEKAANFSFLMLLPVVAGATVIKVTVAVDAGLSIAWGPMILGMLLAFVAGLIAIGTVLKFIRRGRFHFFAVYCFLVGGVSLLFL